MNEYPEVNPKFKEFGKQVETLLDIKAIPMLPQGNGIVVMNGILLVVGAGENNNPLKINLIDVISKMLNDIQSLRNQSVTNDEELEHACDEISRLEIRLSELNQVIEKLP